MSAIVGQGFHFAKNRQHWRWQGTTMLRWELRKKSLDGPIQLLHFEGLIQY